MVTVFACESTTSRIGGRGTASELAARRLQGAGEQQSHRADPAGDPARARPRSGHAGEQSLGEDGPLLGAQDDVGWLESVVTLAPGSTLVLRTDGVTEAVGDGAGFPRKRNLRHFLAVGGQLDVDVAPRGVGVGADGVGCGNEPRRLGRILHVGQVH